MIKKNIQTQGLDVGLSEHPSSLTNEQVSHVLFYLLAEVANLATRIHALSSNLTEKGDYAPVDCAPVHGNDFDALICGLKPGHYIRRESQEFKRVIENAGFALELEELPNISIRPNVVLPAVNKEKAK